MLPWVARNGDRYFRTVFMTLKKLVNNTLDFLQKYSANPTPALKASEEGARLLLFPRRAGGLLAQRHVVREVLILTYARGLLFEVNRSRRQLQGVKLAAKTRRGWGWQCIGPGGIDHRGDRVIYSLLGDNFCRTFTLGAAQREAQTTCCYCVCALRAG